MNARNRILQPLCWSFLALSLLGGRGTSAWGQGLGGPLGDLSRDPILPRDLGCSISRLPTDPLALDSSSKIRLFRIPTGFPCNPLGLDTDAELSGDPATGGNESDPTDGRVLLTLGNDNPYFDFRRPGDPGGIGYYKLHSQFLLVDKPSAGMSVVFQAVTPAGLEADGLATGPTILTPNFAWFYDLGGGTAIQGFFGKTLRTRAGWAEELNRSYKYGLALQSPLPARDSCPSVHLFVEALGRFRTDSDPSQRPSGSWELVPGVHWRLSDSWWLTGGVLLPNGTPRGPDSRLWQITCSWQF
jgi:hypothetical protein